MTLIERQRQLGSAFILGTSQGICPLCGESKTLLHGREGLTVCLDCLDVLADILRAASKPTSKGNLMAQLPRRDSVDRRLLG